MSSANGSAPPTYSSAADPGVATTCNDIINAVRTHASVAEEHLKKLTLAIEHEHARANKMVSIIKDLKESVTTLEAKQVVMQAELDKHRRAQYVQFHNQQARLDNTKITDVKLIPLLSVLTHAVIPGFPKTLRAIDGLNTAQLLVLLRHLGVTSPKTNKQDIKEAFKCAIGV
ncbi:hypothetical protein UCDDS831_g05017 [Diplodia seriata]|uniref:Uncharacterized protein n=1 Tax=Diplodia seriata TaxID=420778 RepID=A0A0G2EC57_9PEZI|nr:hypothetical protein UCDDS831_g05017 [Diplodia seriata]